MAKVGQLELLSCFRKIDAKELKFLTPPQNIKGLFTKGSLEPENSKQAEDDPNSFFISANHEAKKKKPVLLRPNKVEHQEQEHEERHKVYKPGPFARFFQMNEGQLDKDKEVWYYKEKKDIIGPVSSYNMDKMVWFKTIQEDTKVAFQTVDKFVKFSKIKNIVDSEEK